MGTLYYAAFDRLDNASECLFRYKISWKYCTSGYQPAYKYCDDDGHGSHFGVKILCSFLDA